MLFYSVADLIVASEIALIGRVPLSQGHEAAATLRLGHVPSHISSPTKAGPNWTVNETELLLSIPGLASFLLVEGREIRVRLADGRGPEETSPFLTQNLLGLLMQQRGRIVLRASAVAVDGKALLFCGDSAAGKSTVAAAMAARGHFLLADDFCTIGWTEDGTAIVHGDGANLMLWADSIDALGLRRVAGTAVREGCHKYDVRPSAFAIEGLPLGAIYLLGEDRRLATCRMDPLRGIKAAQGIRENTYRPQVLATTAQTLGHFEAATRIVRQEPIFKLARGSSFGWLDEGMQAIEADWSRATQRAPR